MLVIQEAASKLTAASTQMEGFEGKQDELISSVKTLAERVTNLEQVGLKPKKKLNCSVPLYERVSEEQLLVLYILTLTFPFRIWLELSIMTFLMRMRTNSD